MDPKELVTLFRRWLWLLAAGLVLGLLSGFAASRLQTPVYEATAKVLVARSRQQGTTDLLALNDQQLVSTYQQLLKTKPVLREAETRLGITINPDNIKADVLVDTQIIQIKVQDKNPEQAAAIANSLVQILVEQNETLQSGRYSTYEEGLTSQITQVQQQIDGLQGQITQINQVSIEEQLAQVNKQISDLQAEIAMLEKDISGYPSSLTQTQRAELATKQSQLEQLRSLLYLYQQIQTNLTFIGKPVQGSSGVEDPRVTSLQSALNLYQQLYLTLLNNLEAAKLARVQSTPTVTQIEAAEIPKNPVRPVPLLYTALSGIVGLFLAAATILVVEYFDDSLKTIQKVQEIFRVPVLGQISEVNGNHGTGKKPQEVDRERLEQQNAFASLRVNLARMMAQRPQKTVLVTSASRGEGKTTVALNLAEAFVRAGKKAILVDADLYRPQVHRRLGVTNDAGLTEVLSGGMDWQEVSHKKGSLTVIGSGAIASSLSGLLESDEMTALLAKLEKKADVVVVDGPPLFVVDSQILASRVGGVLLVVQQGSTRISFARSMTRQLELIDVHLYGVVLNRVERGDGYYYDSYYQESASKDLQETETVWEKFQKTIQESPLPVKKPRKKREKARIIAEPEELEAVETLDEPKKAGEQVEKAQS